MAGEWRADPAGKYQYRWWNGTAWTEHVSTDGVTSVDPPPAQAPPDDSTLRLPTTPAQPAAQPTEPATSPTVFDDASDATLQIPLSELQLPPTAAAQPAVQLPPTVANQPVVPSAGFPPPSGFPPPAGYSPPAPSGYSPPAPQPAEPKGSRAGLIAVVVVLLGALGAGAFFFLRDDGDEQTATDDEQSDDSSDEGDDGDDESSDDGDDDGKGSSDTSTTTTTVASTTTTVAPTTTTSAPPNTVVVDANAGQYFPVDLLAGQAFRYRADLAEGTTGDLVVSVVGDSASILAAAAQSPEYVGQTPEQIAPTLGVPIAVPGLEPTELAIYQTNLGTAHEADWFIAPAAGQYFIVVHEAALLPATFSLTFEAGEVTTVDIFAVTIDDPAVTGPFFTEPAFYQ